jgi:hypothetical protein
MRLKPLCLFILLVAAHGAMAQRIPAGKDTVMKGSTIEVLQSYKPQVKQAPKPEWMPQLPATDTSHPVFTYDVPQQSLYYTYSSLPLHPLALGRDAVKLPFANYIKLGGGNLSTIYLDAGIGGIRGKNYETGIHLHHIQQKGDIVNQQSSLSGIEAEGILHNQFSEWHAAIMGAYNAYNYYGYNHGLYSFSGDSVKQNYTTIRVAVDMNNKPDSGAKLVFNPGINASLYSARFNTSETNIGFNAPFIYNASDAVQLQAAVFGAYTHLSLKDTGIDNSYVEVLPGINIHTKSFNGHALLGLAQGRGSNQYFLPDLLVGVTIPKSKLTISGGWQALLRQNTYEQLTTENPYFSIIYSVRQTRRDEIFGDARFGVGDHLTFSARVSWWEYDPMPMFINYVGDQRHFGVVYDKVQAFSVQVGAKYRVADKWSLGLSGAFYSYNPVLQQYVWHEPDVKIKGEFIFTPIPKLNVTAYLALLSGIHSRDSYGNIQTLNTIADIGGNVEYQFIPRLSAFVQVSNLLNNQYQRWLGYQAYGFNIYGGLRLKF